MTIRKKRDEVMTTKCKKATLLLEELIVEINPDINNLTPQEKEAYQITLLSLHNLGKRGVYVPEPTE